VRLDHLLSKEHTQPTHTIGVWVLMVVFASGIHNLWPVLLKGGWQLVERMACCWVSEASDA
jgi:hypothetical protein